MRREGLQGRENGKLFNEYYSSDAECPPKATQSLSGSSGSDGMLKK
jgi:hypothetical protein